MSPGDGTAGARDPAVDKLRNVLGDAGAAALVSEIFAKLAIKSLDDPNDRMRFGDDLILRGGVLEAIGRSIKVQAILRGARAA